MSDERSRMDERAGREGWIGYAPEDKAAYWRGRAQGGWGAGGGGGGGIFVFALLALSTIFVIVGLFVLVPLYPIAGSITAIVGYFMETYVLSGNDVNGRMKDLAAVLIGIPTLMLTLKLERRAEESSLYRQVRHWIRVVGIAMGINEAILPLISLYAVGREAVRGWGITGGEVAIEKLVRIALLMLALHLFFRWRETRDTGMPLDRRFGLRDPFR